VEAFPLRAARAEEAAEILMGEIFSRYGFPDEIHSDRGTQFTGRVMKQLGELIGYSITWTPAYHPQSNPVERAHRDLKAGIRAALETVGGQEWDQCLPQVLFAFRCTPARGTGLTPFEVLFGRQPNIPIGAVDPAPASGKPLAEYVAKLRGRILDVHHWARENLAKEVARQQRAYQAVQRQFEVGDRVWRYNPVPQKGGKFARSWTGPWEVAEKLSPVLYKLRDDQGDVAADVVPIDRLKCYYPAPNHRDYLPSRQRYSPPVPLALTLLPRPSTVATPWTKTCSRTPGARALPTRKARTREDRQHMLQPSPTSRRRSSFKTFRDTIRDSLTNFIPLNMSTDDILPVLQISDDDLLPPIQLGELTGTRPPTPVSTSTVPTSQADSEEPIIVQVVTQAGEPPVPPAQLLHSYPGIRPAGPSTGAGAPGSQHLATLRIGRTATTHRGIPAVMPTPPRGCRATAGSIVQRTTSSTTAPQNQRQGPAAPQGNVQALTPALTYRMLVAQLSRDIDSLTNWVRNNPAQLTEERLNWLRAADVRLFYLANMARDYMELSEGVHELQTGRFRSRSPVGRAG
jgi:hypothetical protein